MTNLEAIQNEAKKELKEADFRVAVESMKQRLKNKRSFWDRVFPWKITIQRKGRKYV